MTRLHKDWILEPIITFRGKSCFWKMNDGHCYHYDGNMLTPKNLFRDNQKIFEGNFQDYEISNGKVYVRRRLPDRSSILYRDQEEIIHDDFDEWTVHEGAVYVRKDEKQPDGKCRMRIFRNSQEVFFGECGPWEVADGKLLVKQSHTDGNSVIMCGDMEVAHGPIESWIVEDGKLFVKLRLSDNADRIVHAKQVLFEGRLSEWDVVGGQVYAVKHPTHEVHIIYRGRKQIFNGQVNGWYVLRNQLLIGQRLPNDKWRLLCEGAEIVRGNFAGAGVHQGRLFLSRWVDQGTEIYRLFRRPNPFTEPFG